MFKKLFGTVVTVFKLYMYFYQTFLNLFTIILIYLL